MKSFTKMLLMFAFLLSSTFAFSQAMNFVKQEEPQPEPVAAPAFDAREGDRAVLLNEGFEGGTTIPAGWSIEQVAGTNTWTFVTASTGTPNTAYTGSYKARFYSPSSSVTHTAKLITPEVVIPVDELGVLSFAHTQRVWFGDQDELRVYYRTSSVDPWTMLAEYTASITDWTPRQITLPGGTTTVQFAFEGNGGFGYGVQLDDVVLESFPPLGDISGYVFNSQGTAVYDALVTMESTGLTTRTDPTGQWGFLQVNSGEQDFTASKVGYNDVTATADIPPSGSTTLNITLTSPNINVNPLSFSENLHPNESATRSLGLLNTGTGPVDWAAGIVFHEDERGLVSMPVSVPRVETEPRENRVADANTSAGPIPRNLSTLPSHESTSSLRGSIAFGYETQSSAFYDFDIDDYPAKTLVSSYATPITGMAMLRNETDFAYGVSWDNLNLYSIDRATGAATDMGVPTGTPADGFNDITVDPTTNVIYAAGANDALYIIDPIGMTTTFIGNFVNSEVMIGIACDGEGNLWGYDIGWDEFYSIDKNTGVATSIGSIGFDALYGQALFYDQASDNIIMAAFNNTTFTAQIRAVDKTTGASVVLSESAGLEQVAAAVLPVSGSASGWLTLDTYSGAISGGGGSNNVGVNFNASGTSPGEVYRASIIISTNPFVGEITIPVTMTIGGEEWPVVSEITAQLLDEATGEVRVMWSGLRAPNLDYYRVLRNGQVLTTTSETMIEETLPGFGAYAYSVQPIFVEGDGVITGPAVVEWFEPQLCLPLGNSLVNTQWPDEQKQVTLEIQNCTPPDGGVQYRVEMFDSYGDGWNGASLDVYVDGVFAVNATLASGSGPGYAEFDVASGLEITGTWNPGSYDGECRYNIRDMDNNIVFSSPSPVAGIPAGVLFADDFWGEGVLTYNFNPAPEPCATYTLSMTDTWGDGWNGAALDVYVNGELAVTGTVPGGTSNSVEFDVLPGAEITGVWTSGSYDYECRYSILDCNGELIYGESGAGDIPAGLVFVAADFVVDISPMSGEIQPGDIAEVVLTYSSNGYGEGSYFQEVTFESNESGRSRTLTYSVFNNMIVEVPAAIDGIVKDCGTGEPIGRATITAEKVGDPDVVFTTETAPNGTYILYVDEDTDYNVTASKPGYQAVTVTEFIAQSATIDFELCEAPYPVSMVYADPNQEDTQAEVTWTLPMGPYLVAYDDGSAENYFGWNVTGGMSAVKFTPAGYPATVEGGHIYVGDGSYPENANFLGNEMELVVMDNTGTDGLPGEELGSVVVTVDDYGWVHFSGLDVTIEEGDFYIAYRQLQNAPNAAPVGIDTDAPTAFRSYVKASNGDWMVSTFQDMMIRAIVSGPGPNVTRAESEPVNVYGGKLDASTYNAMAPAVYPVGVQGEGRYIPILVATDYDRVLEKYVLSRISGIDPDNGIMPADGVHLVLQALTAQSYTDMNFGNLPAGFYAYGVEAIYSNTDTSDITYSNIVAHKLHNEVVFNVSQCDGESPEGANLQLVGHNYPYMEFEVTVDASGLVVFDSVIDGTYDLLVTKMGYIAYDHRDIWIYDDYEEDVILFETPPNKPRNLVVDPLTLEATWDSPYVEYLNEGFDEDAEFPAAGWQIVGGGAPWEHTNVLVRGFWTIPAPLTGDGWFALVDDDAISDAATETALVLPAFDLSETDGLSVSLDAFFMASGGEEAYVIYSTNGADWNMFYPIEGNASAWQSLVINLDELAGEPTVYVGLYYVDNGAWAYGMAVDNVKAYIGTTPPNGYNVYLDGGLVGSTAADVTTYTYEDLEFGQEYVAEVRATSACGESEPVYYTFTSTFLYPPRNLGDEYIVNTDEVPLMWNPPYNDPEAQRTSVLTSVDFNSLTDVDLPISEYSQMSGTTTGISRDLGCPEGSIFSNPGTDFTLATTSEESQDYVVAQRLNDLPSEFNTVKFYGLSAIFSGSWSPCDSENPMPFRIATWEDGSTPGDLIDEFEVEIELEDTGELFAGAFPIWSFTATIEAQNFTDGWISIQGLETDSECWFLWLDSPSGSGEGIQWDGAAWGATDDPLALCLSYEDAPPMPEDGLVSFNIYRDGEYIGNTPYDGGDIESFYYYVDSDVMPGCYDYEVTAVYDLTSYGFPGEIGESRTEGPHEVCVVWGYDLPFYEDWTQGTFEFNHWELSSDNWVISSQTGNPAPSAQWNWDPNPGADYMSTLTSPPFNAASLTEGMVYFEFDIALDDRNATGTETMMAQVFDGMAWHTVATFDNADGSFDYEGVKVDISEYAMGDVFWVRFAAAGVNSFDVINWNIDNISLYRECVAPFNLTGEYTFNSEDEFGAMVCWEITDQPVGGDVELVYDNGTMTGAYSFTGATMSTHMSPAGPAQVLQLKYYTSDGVSFNAEIYGWNGTSPGTTLLYTEPANAVVEDWVVVDISDENFQVDGDFVVGFGSIDAVTYLGYDAGLNNGRSWDYAGGSWSTWSEAYLIRAVVRYPDGRIAEIGAGTHSSEVSIAADFSNNAHGTDYSSVVAVDPVENNAGRALTGFNIYRMEDGAADYELLTTVASVPDETEYCFFDTDVDAQMGYYYQVTAVYGSDTDGCESSPAASLDLPENDFVYVFITSTNEFGLNNTRVYPNPATNNVVIESAQMNRITVMNAVGQLVIDRGIEGDMRYDLNTSAYEAGVYMIRIETTEGVVTKRLTIVR